MRRNRYENRTRNKYNHSLTSRNDFNSKSKDFFFFENRYFFQLNVRNFSRNEYFAFKSLSKKSYLKELTLLKKIYNYNDKFKITKDNFDFKLQIYINKCKRDDISSHAYDKKTDIMLKKKS